MLIFAVLVPFILIPLFFSKDKFLFWHFSLYRSNVVDFLESDHIEVHLIAPCHAWWNGPHATAWSEHACLEYFPMWALVDFKRHCSNKGPRHINVPCIICHIQIRSFSEPRVYLLFQSYCIAFSNMMQFYLLSIGIFVCYPLSGGDTDQPEVNNQKQKVYGLRQHIKT